MNRAIRYGAGANLPSHTDLGVPELIWGYIATAVSAGMKSDILIAAVDDCWFTMLPLRCGCTAMVMQPDDSSSPPPEHMYRLAYDMKIRHLLQLPGDAYWLDDHLRQPIFN